LSLLSKVKYHKDQANEKDYSHKGLGFYFKQWQADHVSDWMDDPRVKEFLADKDKGGDGEVNQYKDGKADASKI